nr:PREDICTED: lateral signaling target protein 2 homolog isoform X1 [Bemisia tabaci]
MKFDMESFRKWFYKPKKDDTSLLAQFFYADEALNFVAAALDSFDGREDPDRCTVLVNHLRQCQDKVLTICNKIMDELIPNERADRDFRAKFPDDVMQDNLAGQLWFGAECLAAGSSILNRENESSAMRPLAKALTKSLENVRTLLREHSLRSNSLHQLNMFNELYADRLIESLKMFDHLLAEFELCYVSAMVPVKTAHEYQLQQLVIVLFSETLQRALKLGLLSQDQIDQYDPALMLTIPRLAIVCGLLFYTESSLCLDGPPSDMSEMFRPFRTLLMKIRELLWTLSDKELYTLEKMLCSSSDNTPPSSFATLNKPSEEESGWQDSYTENSECETMKSSIKDDSVQPTPFSSHRESFTPKSSSLNLNFSDNHCPYPCDVENTPGIACTSNIDTSSIRIDYDPAEKCFVLLENSDDDRSTSLRPDDGSWSDTDDQSCNTVLNLSCKCRLDDATASNICDSCNCNQPPEGCAIPESAGGFFNANKVRQETPRQDLPQSESLPDGDPKLAMSLATETLSSILNNDLVPDSGVCTQTNSEGDVSSADRTPDKEEVPVSSVCNLGTSPDYFTADSDSSQAGPAEERSSSLHLTNLHSIECSSQSGVSDSIPRDSSLESSHPSGISDDLVKKASLDYNKISEDLRWVSQNPDAESSSKYDDYLDNVDRNLGKSFDSNKNLSKVLLNHSNSVTSVILNHKVQPEMESDESSSREMTPQGRKLLEESILGVKKAASRYSKSSSEVMSSSVSSSCSCSSSSYPSMSVTSSCSVHSSDTSSFDSEFQDYEEIALAMQASRLSHKSGVRAKFRSSEDLIHRLFVCIAGVADQLQTNFAADLRNILKCVFLMNASLMSETESIVEEPITNAEEHPGDLHRDSIEDGEEALSWRDESNSPNGRRREDLEIAPAWVPDDLAPHCMACDASFTVVRRRHHCRNCGKVFCARCSSNSVPLPRYGHVKPVRVCNRCFIYQVTPFTLTAISS